MSEIDKVYDEHKSCLERLESLQSENADWVDKYAEACRQRDAVKAQYDSLRALAGKIRNEVERHMDCQDTCDIALVIRDHLAAYSKATKGHGDE